MISRPSAKVMQNFRALRGNPNFEAILKFLEDSSRQLDKDSRHCPEDYKVRLKQGGAEVIDEILTLYEESKRL